MESKKSFENSNLEMAVSSDPSDGRIPYCSFIPILFIFYKLNKEDTNME
jgi:hypothetical protein